MGTIAATFTYSAPLIERLWSRLFGKQIVLGAAREVGKHAAKIIGMRILFMSTGAWITLGTFTIQVFVWQFSDDALENWLSLSAFGKNRDASKAYSTAEIQFQALESALNEVGLGP